MHTNTSTIHLTSCFQPLINTRTSKRYPGERNADYRQRVSLCKGFSLYNSYDLDCEIEVSLNKPHAVVKKGVGHITWYKSFDS